LNKKVKPQQQQQNKIANINIFPEPGIEPRTSSTAVRRLTSPPQRQMKVSIEVKQFNVTTLWVKTKINKTKFVATRFQQNSFL